MSFDIIGFAKSNFETIWPTVTGIAGTVISALFFRKRNQIETRTQEFEMVKAGLLKDAAQELLQSGRLTYTEYYKMENFIEIAKRADEVFREESANVSKLNENNDGVVNEIPPQNFDWHTRFFESCGNISDAEMQILWARVLAGEIRKPGSYSLRTIECLRNLTKEEALLFLKICYASIRVENNVILPRIDTYLEQKSITYDDIIKLDDCGLVKNDATIVLSIKLLGERSIVTSNNNWVLLFQKNGNDSPGSTDELSIDEYMFTQCGKELFSVVDIEEKNDYSDICDAFKRTYKNFDFIRGQIIEKHGKMIRYATIGIEIKEKLGTNE